MAVFSVLMCQAPDNLRIANLKLAGFRTGTLLYFCPQCDFQIEARFATRPVCPSDDATLVLTTVTAELVRTTRAVAA